MRVAAIQLRVHAGRRTEALQSALRAIDSAAEAVPAPDLIVLPAFSDVLAVAAGSETVLERCAGPTVAACGLRARQWGVFIALGFAEAGANKPHLTAALLDRDGDLRRGQRQMTSGAGAIGAFETGTGFDACDILLGRVALLAGDDCLDAGLWDRAAAAGAGLVLGMSGLGLGRDDSDANRDRVRRVLCEQAARTGIPAVVADVATIDVGGTASRSARSMIIDAGGEVLATAQPSRAAILTADLTTAVAETGATTEGAQ